jgi:organic hydroperoxide reductase OsmC/OhrA
MTKVLYTAHAHVIGGRDGHGHSSDRELDLNRGVSQFEP